MVAWVPFVVGWGLSVDGGLRKLQRVARLRSAGARRVVIWSDTNATTFHLPGNEVRAADFNNASAYAHAVQIGVHRAVSSWTLPSAANGKQAVCVTLEVINIHRFLSVGACFHALVIQKNKGTPLRDAVAA